MNTRLVRIARRMRALPRDLLGVSALRERMDQLETRLYESDERLRGRSKARWTVTEPTPRLTWGRELTGDAFVSRVEQYAPLGPELNLLEIGPGYGRLLRSILARRLPFRRYCGVDLSRANVEALRRRIEHEGVAFLIADAETVELPEPVDRVISSLTLKHFYPSFEAALRNVVAQARPGCRFCFDLIEGSGRRFERDEITYVREYSRPEVIGILEAVGLRHVAFDSVAHSLDPCHVRLFVVAEKPG